MCRKFDKISKESNHQNVKDTVEALENMKEGGGVEPDGMTSHGVGLKFKIPYKVLQKREELKNKGLQFEKGKLAVATVFLPKNPDIETPLLEILYKNIEEEIGVKKDAIFLTAPERDNSDLSPMAKSLEPEIKQLVFNIPEGMNEKEFTRKLLLANIKTRIDMSLEASDEAKKYSDLVGMSNITYTMKGPVRPDQFRGWWKEIDDTDFESDFGEAQHRLKTNSPGYPQNAHPYDIIHHNGEFNDIEAFTIYMENYIREQWGIDVEIPKNQSDTKRVDLYYAIRIAEGVPLEQVMFETLRYAWQDDNEIDPKVKNALSYFDSISPPLVGPAFVSGYDPLSNKLVLANDPSGDRDSVIIELTDGSYIFASDFGQVKSIPRSRIKSTSILKEGEILEFDIDKWQITRGDELKLRIANDIEKRTGINFEELEKDYIKPEENLKSFAGHGNKTFSSVAYMMAAVGTDMSVVNAIVDPMIGAGKYAVSAMNPQVSEPALSKIPQASVARCLIQLGAQFSNRAGTKNYEPELFDHTAYLGVNREKKGQENARNIRTSDLLRAGEYESILKNEQVRTYVVNATFNFVDGPDAEINRYKEIEKEIDDALKNGCTNISLSTRGISGERCKMDLITLTGYLNTCLRKTGKRSSCSIVCDTDAMTAHEAAMMLANGASSVNMYLLHDYIRERVKVKEGWTEDDIERAQKEIYVATQADISHTYARCGAYSTRGYQFSKIYYAKGINKDDEIFSKAFKGVSCKLKGKGFKHFSTDRIAHHIAALRQADPNYIEKLIQSNPDKYNTKEWQKIFEKSERIFNLYPSRQPDQTGNHSAHYSGIFRPVVGGEKEYWSAFVPSYRCLSKSYVICFAHSLR